jgi:hypothetical protein
MAHDGYDAWVVAELSGDPHGEGAGPTVVGEDQPEGAALHAAAGVDLPFCELGREAHRGSAGLGQGPGDGDDYRLVAATARGRHYGEGEREPPQRTSGVADETSVR